MFHMVGRTILRIYGPFAAVSFVVVQWFCKLRESAAAQHVHTRDVVLNLLALQFEQGTVLSHRIFLVRQESH
jgi:hypothetical protein